MSAPLVLLAIALLFCGFGAAAVMCAARCAWQHWKRGQWERRIDPYKMHRGIGA